MLQSNGRLMQNNNKVNLKKTKLYTKDFKYNVSLLCKLVAYLVIYIFFRFHVIAYILCE